MDRIEGQEVLHKLLKAHHHSITTVRKAVFDSMFSREPMTMHELLERLGSAADRASVYRTIQLFEQIGIVQRLQIGWKHKFELSDRFSQHHHHITCSRCGRTTSVADNTELEQVIKNIAADAGYSHHNHQLEIVGICEECQKLMHHSPYTNS